jgi:hypothetical protein
MMSSAWGALAALLLAVVSAAAQQSLPPPSAAFPGKYILIVITNNSWLPWLGQSIAMQEFDDVESCSAAVDMLEASRQPGIADKWCQHKTQALR